MRQVLFDYYRLTMNPIDRKAVFGWTMYDWANSAFATTVLAGFFPVFFNEYWSRGVGPAAGTARLGLANSLAGLVVAILAPLLGAIADRGSARKRFLIFFAAMGVVMTSSLYLVGEGDYAAAIFLFVIASVGFSGGNIFYDALLTAVSPKKRMDSVSSLGFALGYLGGGLLFAVNVWMTLRPAAFGFSGAQDAVRFSFVTVGIWWAVFSIPLILYVKEPERKGSRERGAMVREGLLQLRDTFREIRHLKTIFLFLLAYWCYIDGVDTVVRMAVHYGLSIGLNRNDLITALLITQFIGFPSAILFGRLGARIGTRRAVFIGIAIYLAVTVWAAFMRDRSEFYMLAAAVGLVQGGIQALSRSFFARMIPADKSAEYFGFYNMIGKFAAVLGPALMALTALIARSAGYTGLVSTRIGIASVSILFIAGGVLLFFVDEDKGTREAVYLSEKEGPGANGL